jgi:nitroreductase
MLYDLVKKNRSYRRFHQEVTISIKQLKSWIDLARLSPSGRNAQPLKYIISNTQGLNERIFPHLAWAGYLKEWPGPEEGERPSAYLVMLGDTTIANNYLCDHGIAAQSILLGAVEEGFGGCIIAAVKREALHKELKIPGHLEILQVIALGKPKEEVKLEEMNGDDFKYWRDDKQIHHVPKRNLDDLIVTIDE